jgi:hypothetical protein
MDEPPSNELVCAGPLYFVVDETTIEKNPLTGKPNFSLGNPGVACVEGKNDLQNDVLCVAIFTDHDLALKFAEDRGKNFIPSAFPNPASFIWFLKKMQASGQTHVAIDPYKPGFRMLVQTIPEFVAALRECRIDTEGAM